MKEKKSLKKGKKRVVGIEGKMKVTKNRDAMKKKKIT